MVVNSKYYIFVIGPLLIDLTYFHLPSTVSGTKRGLPQGHAERPAGQQEAGRAGRRLVHRRIRHRADQSLLTGHGGEFPL